MITEKQLKNKDFKYQREEKRIIKIDNIGFKIDSYFYNKMDKLIAIIKGEPLYFPLNKSFIDNKIQLVLPIIKEFIINSQKLSFIANHKPNNFHCLEDLNQEKRESLFIPNDLISNILIQKMIDKHLESKRKTANQIKPSKIKTCTIFKIDNHTFSIETEYHNGVNKKEIKEHIKIFLKDLLIPKAFELWGIENPLSSIEKTNISKQQNGILFYEIFGKNGVLLKAQIDRYTFDSYGVALFQRMILKETQNPNLFSPAIINETIKRLEK